MSPLSFIAFFFLYSFIGWILDTSYRSFVAKRYAPRSFFPVPLCPIYGIGALFVLLTYPSLNTMPIPAIWLFYAVVLGLFEGLSGFLIKKVFDRRLWDYEKELGSIGGFTDLLHACIWGTLALVVIFILHPFILQLLPMLRT